MTVMLPSAELMSQWAAEQAWDWRVRLLFAIVCACAVVLALVICLLRDRASAKLGVDMPRRYLGRISVTLFVIAAAEALFFKEPVSTALVMATAAVVGAIALNMPSADTAANALEDGHQSESA